MGWFKMHEKKQHMVNSCYELYKSNGYLLYKRKQVPWTFLQETDTKFNQLL